MHLGVFSSRVYALMLVLCFIQDELTALSLRESCIKHYLRSFQSVLSGVTDKQWVCFSRILVELLALL